jgi:glycosyl transferase, family 25
MRAWPGKGLQQTTGVLMPLPDGMAAYLINLPASVARRDRSLQQLRAMDIAAALFPAIDGRAQWEVLKPTLDEAAFRRNTGRAVMPGEIGCYHSHLGVWKAFLQTDSRVALVLEDDVVFHADFPEALTVAMTVEARWDFLKLNRIRAKQPVRQGRAGRWHVNAYVGPATGLGAYLIRRDLAGRLLPAMLPITRPIDHELDRTHLHRFRHFGLEPFPSSVDDGGVSTINGAGNAEVQKFPWYRRLPVHGVRLSNRIGKLMFMARNGQLRPSPEAWSEHGKPGRHG